MTQSLIEKLEAGRKKEPISGGFLDSWGNGYEDALDIVRKHQDEQWQPIETAPKDGTKLLLLEYTGTILHPYYAGEWNKTSECWAVHCGQPVVYTPEPTHWMPLPPSPPGIVANDKKADV